MSDNGSSSGAAREYAVEYATLYSERDLAMALRRYMKIIASHASAREAGYSRTQIQDIAPGCSDGARARPPRTPDLT